MKNKKAIQLVVFDFDGTITLCDTFIEFAKKAIGKSRLFKTIIYCSPWLAAWKLGIIAGGSAKQKLFAAIYRGRSYDWLVKQGEKFAGIIESFTRQEILQALHDYTTKGCQVFILSASMPEWIRPWASRHGILADHVIGTECEVDDNGIITGEFATPNCYGAEKVRRLTDVVGDLSSYYITAYGDSKGDFDLFAIADTKIKV